MAFSLGRDNTLGTIRKLLRQDFQRHVPVQLGIGGTVDFAHASLANFLKNLVMRDGLAEHGTPLPKLCNKTVRR